MTILLGVIAVVVAIVHVGTPPSIDTRLLLHVISPTFQLAASPARRPACARWRMSASWQMNWYADHGRLGRPSGLGLRGARLAGGASSAAATRGASGGDRRDDRDASALVRASLRRHLRLWH